MFENYLKTTFRNFWRYRGYTAINLSGLAIGLATCIIIFTYISYELSYDKFHEDHGDVYRIAVKGRFAEDFFNVAVSMPPIAPKLKTENLARKYFGGEDPMGMVIRLNDQVNMKVTGILKDIPGNCHLKFNMLGSIETIIRERGRERYDDNWGSLFLHSYIRLHSGSDADAFGTKIQLTIRDAFGEVADRYNIEMIPYLQKVSDIHLRSNLLAELEPNSDISYIYIFSAVAIFILVIACINFMNLSTARSTRRSREVGMRKVAGATRGQLAWQFIGESFLLSLMALIVALALVESLLPVFSQMTGLQLETFFHSPFTLLMALALTIIVGFFAGTYPALVLSSFQPVRAIRGELYQGMKKSALRNLLVVLQFTISIALLVSTWLIYEQMQFVRNKNMGFDRENIVIIPLRSDRLKEKASVFRDEMEQIPSVSMISLSSSTPGKMIDGIGYVPEGIDSKSPWIIYTLRADDRFTGVMGMEIKEGRGFSPEYGTDSMATIINRALVSKLGWTNPVGKKIYHFGEGEDVPDDERRAYHVIGVVEDFHFKSLHDLIEPALIILHSGQPNFLAVRIYPGNTGESVRLLREKWEELEQAIPFDHYFLGEAYDELYRPEQKMAQLFITFTILAMLIACLGLFGLALFSIEQRVKEIGIRKILGAGVPGLLYRLSLEFSRWVVLSAVIAWPVAYLLVDNWLQAFAYRIDILHYAWVFILSGLAALAVALLTVIYQAYRAATRNPVEAVKYE